MNMAKILAIGVLVLLGSFYVAAVLIAMIPYLTLILIGGTVTGIIMFKLRKPPDDSSDRIEGP